MTEKQKRFANEYIIDLNATRAYKATYPKVKSDSTASVNASKLLRNAKVKAYIEELMKERAKRTEISQDDVIKELCKIGFSKITDFVVIENGVVRALVRYTLEDIGRRKNRSYCWNKRGAKWN